MERMIFVNVIFLDIDGVLNPYPNQRQNMEAGTEDTSVLKLDSECMKVLRRIIEKTGAKLVLSSSWRCEEWYGGFASKENVERQLQEYGMRLLDATPVLPVYDRGKEILCYLQEHPEVEKFLILDDDRSVGWYEELKEHFLRTDPEVGLAGINIRKIKL